MPALIREPTGHVDLFVQLAAEDHLLIGRYDPEVEPANAALLDETAEWLSGRTTASGDVLRVSRVPMPTPAADVYPSHLNATVVNDVVLVPVYRNYGDVEREAIAVLRRAFPGAGWSVSRPTR